jgi:DnaJ-domain-containing protein 1
MPVQTGAPFHQVSPLFDMSDYFALLGQPRLPWLDANSLRKSFLALSAALHPDRSHAASTEEKAEANHRYAELNAAFNCLLDPRHRLLHLLELELGKKPAEVQRIPPGTMDLFIEVGQVCRETDEYLERKRGTTSPLLKAKIFREGTLWADKLMALQARINARQDELHRELASSVAGQRDAGSSDSGSKQLPLSMDRLEQIYRVLSYISRWNGQIQDRLVQLAE